MKKIILLLLWLIIGYSGALNAQTLNFNLPLSKEDAVLQERAKSKSMEMEKIQNLGYQRARASFITAEKGEQRAEQNAKEESEIDRLMEITRQNDLKVIGDAIIQRAPIVFEGRVLKSEQYFNTDSSQVHHSAIIQIVRVIRGNEFIKVGTIEIQSEPKPFINNKETFKFLNWQLPICKPYIGSFMCEDFPQAGEHTQLFFSKIKETALPHFTNPFNEIILEDYKKLEYDKYCSIIYPNQEDLGFGGLYNFFRVFSVEELHSYALKYGLDLKYKDMPTKNTKKEKYKNKKVYKFFGLKTKRTTPPYSILTMRFNNQIQTTDAVNSYIEFDLEVKANYDMEFGQGWFNFLMYKPLFATVSPDSIRFIGGFKSVVYSTGTAFGSYTSSTPSSTDSVKLGIAFYTSNLSGTRAALSTVYTTVAHIRLKITGCAQGLGTALVQPETNAFFYYQNTGDYQFNSIVFEPSIMKNAPNAPNVPTEICATTFDFFPKTIHGGNDEILTITATQGGFGDSTSLIQGVLKYGTVHFTNGENPEAASSSLSSYANPANNFLTTNLPRINIVSWSNSIIKVKVPSDVNSTQHAGTGFFRIQRADGSSIFTSSTQYLNIRYAFTNSYIGATQSWERFYIPNRNCHKGIIFGIDSTNLKYLPVDSATPVQIIKGIQDAASYWSRTIGGDSIKLKAILIDKNNPRSDIMGIISFINSTDRSDKDMATTTVPVSQPIQTTGNKFAFNGANIAIYLNRLPYKWWVDSSLTQPKQVNQADFFCVLLHEMGHSLGLHHAHDFFAPDRKVELMSKLNYKGDDLLTSAQRMTPTTGMSSAKHGVQRMVKDSYGIAWRDVANANPGQVGTLGNTTAPPVLTSNPLHQLVCLTTTTNFKVTTNTAGSYYQWKNADTGANLAGVSATTANYSTASTGAYNCLVSKNGCSTLSKTAVFEQMPKIYVTDSLHKCTNQPIEIYAPKFRSPLIFTATGTGVSMLNGRVMVKPSAITNNDQTQVDYKLTNPAQPAQTGQAAQAAQECTGYSGIRLLSNTIFTPDTRIKTCPPTTNCLHQSVNNISIPQFQIASLGCYKTGIHYILQLSNVGGTFPATSVTNIPNKIFDTTTVIKRQDFSLLIPKMMFPSTGLYKIRLVLYTPGAVPTISYSSNVCTFTVKVVQFFSQCALEDRPQVKYENIVDPPTLYPNPTTDRFTLQTPEYDAATEVSISDAQGRMISQQNVYTTSNEIETHELPNGFYYVRVAQGERSTVLKLVILK